MRNLSIFIGSIGAFAVSQLMVAQAGAPIEAELEAEIVLVLAPFQDQDGAAKSEDMLGELSLSAKAEKVLDNGVRLRVRTNLRMQRDHGARSGGTGGFGSQAGAPVGAFSGLSDAPVRDDQDLRIRLETAYFQIDGGYGEVRVGKDLGVAARFHEGTKSVLSHARLDSALLDPSGLSTIRTRHNLTGPSLKVSYATPRIIGLRAGISFTPNADSDGLDRRPAAGTGGVAPDTTNAIELALNGTRRFRESGLRIDAALAWSTADVASRSGLAPYGRIETFSAGTRIEKDDWTFGASWLSSDNGLPGSDYSAWSAGIAREAYNVDWSLEYGESEDDNAIIDSSGWRLGAARNFGDQTRIALAYSYDQLDNSLYSSTSQGIVVEITLSSEILKITGN